MRPSDTDRFIVPRDTGIAFGPVRARAQIRKSRLFRQHLEAMGKTFGNPELLVILGAQVDRRPTPEIGRIGTKVDGHVEHSPGSHPDQLSLRLGPLIMQTSQDAEPTMAGIDLRKRCIDAGIGKSFIAPVLEKPSTLVAEHIGSDQLDAGKLGIANIHSFSSAQAKSRDAFTGRPRACPVFLRDRNRPVYAATTPGFRDTTPRSLPGRIAGPFAAPSRVRLGYAMRRWRSVDHDPVGPPRGGATLAWTALPEPADQAGRKACGQSPGWSARRCRRRCTYVPAHHPRARASALDSGR